MAKGSQFERDICRQLSIWWTDGARDDIFWRTAGSGAMATTRAKKGKTTAGQVGDITFTDPIGKPLIDSFTFELKRGYNKENVGMILDRTPQSKPGALETWLSDLSFRSSTVSFYWALIHRRDRRMPLIYLPENFIADIVGLGKSKSKPNIFTKTTMAKVRAKLNKQDRFQTIYVMDWHHFLSVITPNDIKAITS